MVIFKSSFLSYSFKLRGIDTDYLCELPKLASLKKSLFSVHVFWSIQHPNFPTFKFKFSVIYAIPIHAWHATCFAWLHNKTGNPVPPAQSCGRLYKRCLFSPDKEITGYRIWIYLDINNTTQGSQSRLAGGGQITHSTPKLPKTICCSSTPNAAKIKLSTITA